MPEKGKDVLPGVVLEYFSIFLERKEAGINAILFMNLAKGAYFLN